MLIGSSAALDLLVRAENELRARSKGVPSAGFYDGKLAQLWDRARGSLAYTGIGEFSPAAFARLAVTSKEDLKRSPWDYVAVGLDDAAKYYETTGTSGVVTPTPRTVDDIVWNTVSVGTAWRELIGQDDRVLVMLPSDLVPVADLVVNVCEYLGVPHARAYPFATGIVDWDRLVGVLGSLRPTVVFIAPGVAVQFARLLKQRGLIARTRESVRALMMLGEVSTGPMRARIGQWWDASCFDISYGSTETGTLAASCVDGSLHMLTAANFFELRTDAGIEPVGGDDSPRTGTLVVSPLNTYARPLLRFDTGDQVTVGMPCRCGDSRPVVTVHGRATDAITLHQVELTLRTVEEVVYSATTATGYLIEIDADGSYGRLLLERDIDADRAAEPAMVEAVRAASTARAGIRWDDVVFVNALAVTTKSGGSQKSWKRSNIRVVEPVG
ncbi:phenylacetate--CoA ligase family protein [Actinophytocola sediminis]